MNLATSSSSSVGSFSGILNYHYQCSAILAVVVKLGETIVLFGAVSNDCAFLLESPTSSYAQFCTESRRHFTVMQTAFATAVGLSLVGAT